MATATATRPVLVLPDLSPAVTSLLGKAKYTLDATRGNEANGHRPTDVREMTLDGERATELICFHYVRGEIGEAGCACGGLKAHICHRACGGALNSALGGKHICRAAKRKVECKLSHPDPEHVRAALDEWWRSTRGAAPVWSTVTANPLANAVLANTAIKGGARAVASAGGGGHGGEKRHPL